MYHSQTSTERTSRILNLTSLRERLKKLNINGMTPLEALNLLDELKKIV